MDLIKKLLGLTLILLLPAIAYSQDTTKKGNFLSKRANPNEPGLTAKQAIDKIGKEVYIRDTIFNHKIFNNHYRILYVGDRDTSKALHVIIKNPKIHVEAESSIISYGGFSGKIVLYKGKPSIIIKEDLQLATRIQL